MISVVSRSKSEAKRHCRLPGPVRRLMLGVRVGTVIQCDCGRQWRWERFDGWGGSTTDWERFVPGALSGGNVP